MIPKVDFQVHKVLMQAFFFPKLYGGNKAKFDEDVKVLTETFASFEEKILKAIEKYSGYAWTKETVPVFIIPNCMIPYSYTKSMLVDGLPGIVLKVGFGTIREIHILIHELVHVICRQGGFYDQDRTDDQTELVADLVTLYVLKEVFGDKSSYELDMDDFLQNTNMKNKKKYEILHEYLPKWDLTQKPISAYL